MTIINKNRILEDNDFNCTTPNTYEKKVKTDKVEVFIKISTSAKCFNIFIYTSDIHATQKLSVSESWEEFSVINRFIDFINSFYGTNIDKIKPKINRELFDFVTTGNFDPFASPNPFKN